MTPTVSVAPNRDSSANKRAIPIVPGKASPDLNIVYARRLRQESRDVAYRIASSPSFDLRLERVEKDHWLVWDVPTQIFGEGDDPLKAAADFEQTAVRHLSVLERQRDSDVPLPEGQLWQLDYLGARVRRSLRR